jgi:hypothetical protein
MVFSLAVTPLYDLVQHHRTEQDRKSDQNTLPNIRILPGTISTSPPIFSVTIVEIRCAIACTPVQYGTPIATFSAVKAQLVADATSVAATIFNNIFSF